MAHREEAESFYLSLAKTGQKVRVGIEASGYARWFEPLLSELQIESWIGDANEIEPKRARKQKTDWKDAEHYSATSSSRRCSRGDVSFTEDKTS